VPSESTEHDLIYGGLEALRAAMPLGLCAYIHEVGDDAPLLYMAIPRMEDVDPSEAFGLFTALREALDRGPSASGPLDVAGFTAALVVTSGTRSRGLHVAGRRNAALDPRERETLQRLAAGLGAAIHALEDAAAREDGGDLEPIRVSVDLAEGRARAEVAIPLGEEIRTGAGEAGLAGRAVVAAVINATDTTLSLVESGSAPIGPIRACLVLMEDALGRRALGSALIDDETDELHSTATAAMHAASALSADRPRPARLPQERTLH
jgi:hypothetical protein